MTVGPLSKGPMDATSVPSRAILARRFFATFTEAPACLICLRSVCIWATVRPEYWATMTTLEALKTPFSVAMAAFFSARSTSGLSSVGGFGPPVAPAVLLDAVLGTGPAGRRRKPVRRTLQAEARNASAKVRTDQPALRPEIRLHPSMQALSIKPGSRYRQLRRLQSRTGRFTKIGLLPGPFFRIREDIRKGTRSDHL